MKKPLVSIIIPVYNGSNYMKEAIDSALAQTYSPIEVLVVNDGSRDDGATERIALSYGDKIRYIAKENGGVSSALNVGIKEMRGEYFSWLSHDDVYMPDKIEKQMELVYPNGTGSELVLCTSINIDKNSQPISNAKKTFPKTGEKYSWEEAVMYITKHTAGGCAFLIPKIAFEKTGGFDEGLRYCQDVFMWWKIFMNKHTLVFCNYAGVHNRVHDKQLTQTAPELYHKDAYTIAKDIVPLFLEASTKKYNFLYEYAVGEAVHGNFDTVKLCINRAKTKKLFSITQALRLRLLNLYGRIRPYIRVVYYRLKGIKTKK